MYRLSITVRVVLHYASERYTKIPWLESKMKIPYRMPRELMSALSVAMGLPWSGYATCSFKNYTTPKTCKLY